MRTSKIMITAAAVILTLAVCVTMIAWRFHLRLDAMVWVRTTSATGLLDSLVKASAR